MSLSSFLAQLIIPLNLCVTLLVLATLLYIVRWRRLAAALVAFSVVWGIFWSLPASSLWAGGRLEQFYPYHPPDLMPSADAIVVLGGHTAGSRKNWFEPYQKDQLITRSDTAAQLYKAGLAPVIVVSGAALDGGVSEARSMANSLIEQGIPESGIILEQNSHSTRENGVYTARKLATHHLKRVLLVTSALHMPRAMAVFEKLGVDVMAAPSPPQITVPKNSDFNFWLPDLRSFEASRSIIKEYAGLLIYWIRGWI